MASQSQGIQQLLAAEKKAAEKVAEARKRKARRLKQAKDEATEEIEKYREERERQLKEADEKTPCKGENDLSKIETEAAAKIAEMSDSVERNKNAIIDEILKHVYNITPEVHKNYIKKK